MTLEEWKASRTRLGEPQEVLVSITYRPYRSDARLAVQIKPEYYVGREKKTRSDGRQFKWYRVINDHLHCPCAICGHETQWECEEADCRCCNETCT